MRKILLGLLMAITFAGAGSAFAEQKQTDDEFRRSQAFKGLDEGSAMQMRLNEIKKGLSKPAVQDKELCFYAGLIAYQANRFFTYPASIAILFSKQPRDQKLALLFNQKSRDIYKPCVAEGALDKAALANSVAETDKLLEELMSFLRENKEIPTN